MIEQTLSRERLRQVLSYCPETGVFRSRSSRGCVAAGQVVGKARPDGYICFNVDGRAYYAHRLAFLYQNDFLPLVVDHRNGVKHDNRIDNLRAADHFINAQNSRKESVGSSSSRFRGVSRAGKKWVATIMGHSKYLHIGRFESEVHAAFAYDMSSLEIHGSSGCRNFLPLAR